MASSDKKTLKSMKQEPANGKLIPFNLKADLETLSWDGNLARSRALSGPPSQKQRKDSLPCSSGLPCNFHRNSIPHLEIFVGSSGDKISQTKGERKEIKQGSKEKQNGLYLSPWQNSSGLYKAINNHSFWCQS